MGEWQSRRTRGNGGALGLLPWVEETPCVIGAPGQSYPGVGRRCSGLRDRPVAEERWCREVDRAGLAAVLMSMVSRGQTGLLELRADAELTRMRVEGGLPTRLLAGVEEPPGWTPFDRIVSLARWPWAEVSFERALASFSTTPTGTPGPWTPLVTRALRTAFDGGEIARLLAPIANVPLVSRITDPDLCGYGLTAPEIKTAQAAPGLSWPSLSRLLAVLGVAPDESRCGVFLALSAGLLGAAGWSPGPASVAAPPTVRETWL